MVLICTANVFGRYVFNHAISWADEVDICLLAWVTFVGAAAGYKRNRHYGMDFILTRLPEKAKKNAPDNPQRRRCRNVYISHIS